MLFVKSIFIILFIMANLFSQQSWQKLDVNGCNKNIWRMTESENGNIFVKCGIEKIFYSSNNGESWDNIPLNFDSHHPNFSDLEIFSLASDSLNRLYVGGWSGKIYRTANLGETWDTLNISTEESALVWDIEIIGKNIYAITGDNFYYSPDFGLTWIIQDSIDKSGNLEDIAVGANGILFIADFDLGVHKSFDNGNTWLVSDSGLTYPFARSIIMYNDSTIFLGTDGGGVFKSLDNGDTWQNCSRTNSAIHEIASFDIDKSGALYAQGENDIVSRTIDLGETWSIIPEASGVYLYLLIDSNDHFYLSTSEGLFFLDSLVTSIVSNGQVEKSFDLQQNYPNPFNPKTVINYQLKVNSDVKLFVYDVLGREVKTLVNKIQPAGKHKVTFNASNLASGIYYYKLRTNDFEQTRKMLLLS